MTVFWQTIHPHPITQVSWPGQRTRVTRLPLSLLPCPSFGPRPWLQTSLLPACLPSSSLPAQGSLLRGLCRHTAAGRYFNFSHFRLLRRTEIPSLDLAQPLAGRRSSFFIECFLTGRPHGSWALSMTGAAGLISRAQEAGGVGALQSC